MGTDRTPNERADLLASRQHGAITLAQALGCGLTAAEITRHVRTGRWRRARPGSSTFVVGGSPDTWLRSTGVACLAGPPGTVASHLSAAAVHGLWKPPAIPHVTVPPGSSARMGLARVHRSPLEREDVTVVRGIPCTRPPRFLVEAAALLPFDGLCELVDDVLCTPLCLPADVRTAMQRASKRPGRKGLADLSRALTVWTPGPRPQSRGEMRFLRRLLAEGLPAPVRQVVVLDGAGRFIAQGDFGYPDFMVLLEYDGQRYHGPRQAPLDTARQRRVEALGWTVVRVTKYDLRPNSTEVWSRIRELLGLGPMPLRLRAAAGRQ